LNRTLDDLRRACERPLPHPAGEALRADGDAALAWVLHHFGTLPEQPIGLMASRPEMEALLREPPPEQGRPFDDVLARFAADVTRFACRPAHPRFLAFIPSAPCFASVLGELLCAGANFFAGVWLEAPGPSMLELVVLDWFRSWLGLPASTAGVLTSGGSEANLTALVTARDPLGDDDRRRAVVYVTEQRHWSVDRAARIIGLRPDQVRPVSSDDPFRLTPAALVRAVAADRQAGRLPWVVVANAGSTNTGAVDSLPRIAEICEAERLWLHVDAAYGWSAALTDEGRLELAGIERADSVTLDPHKWLAQTFEVGCLLVRDGPRLTHAFTLRPDYMKDVEPGDDEVNFADRSLALTRRFRALKVWLSLQTLGVEWFRALVTRCCQLAELAQALLERAGSFEVLSPRQLSIVCFRYSPPGRAGDDVWLDRLNLALIDAVRATGRAFLSSTRLSGRVAVRFCFVNWRTTTADVEEIVDLLRRLGEELADRI
jgi:glutamate/tyrosine decarboxylase-like PLP-dependent enzyme